MEDERGGWSNDIVHKLMSEDIKRTDTYIAVAVRPRSGDVSRTV